MTTAVLPLAILGVAAVVAMLLAPRGPADAPRLAAATGLALAALAVLWRLGDAPAPMLPLLADDGLARFGTLLAALSGLAVLGFQRSGREAPALVCIAALGAAALAGAVHVASLFLGLEITSLALIGLFVLPLTAASLEAGYKYLLPGAAGSGALLMGAALAYAATGRLDLMAWHGDGPQLAVATALLLVGLGFKLSLVPFHIWAPDAYDGAPRLPPRWPARRPRRPSSSPCCASMRCSRGRSGTRGWRCSPSPRSSSAIWRRCGNRRSPASSGIRRWRIRAILRR